MSPSALRQIMVPTDFSVSAERAWALAQPLARATGSELVLVHVVPGGASSEAARKWAAEELEDCAGKARAQGLRVRVALRTGVPHREILALAREEDADLIVVATHGRGGLDRARLGSVADQVVLLATCPVLTVPEPMGGRSAPSTGGGRGKVGARRPRHQ